MLVCKSLISGKHIQLPEAIIGNTSWPQDQDIGKPSCQNQQKCCQKVVFFHKFRNFFIFLLCRKECFSPYAYKRLITISNRKKESCPCKQCDQNLISPSCKEGPVSLHGKGHSDQHKNRKHGGDQMRDPFTASAKNSSSISCTMQ